MNIAAQTFPKKIQGQPQTGLDELYLAEEQSLVAGLVAVIGFDPSKSHSVGQQAGHWVNSVRERSKRSGVIDAFLQEYGLSTPEGIILMRLSEALIRTPDFNTAQALMRDKLGAGSWAEHSGLSPFTVINAATAGLRISASWISATGGEGAANLAAKMGDRVLHAAVVRGMGVMGEHFVLGKTIEEAVRRGRSDAQKGALYSFDMLGEGACTFEDAERYFQSYLRAINHLATTVDRRGAVADSPGLSVKLSALHPRYEYAKRTECMPPLIEKLVVLGKIAKASGLGLMIDAEEASRLEISLEIFDALLAHDDLADWDGLGLVIQAYQRRAMAVIDHVVSSARAANRRVAIRLVKGAYWDAEIKHAQELGLSSYPVFTRKEHTDVSYLACARSLLDAHDVVFPQFATHNAHTAAAILAMAGEAPVLEFQRLHGMGEALHDEIRATSGVRTRIYAPVGSHKDLLPYLVRRLLENGANSSFVNQLLDPDVEVDEIVRDPVAMAKARAFRPGSAIPSPRELYGDERANALGLDLTQASVAEAAQAQLATPLTYEAHALLSGKKSGKDSVAIVNPANEAHCVGHAFQAGVADVQTAVTAAQASSWPLSFPPAARAACLNRAADLLEQRMSALMALCVVEAGKTLPDAMAEVREAVDFCRYYAVQATSAAMADRHPIGVVACISPWNFPLAIFMGQVAAALVAGNTVVAKPAGQTPLIAYQATLLLHDAGVPADALHLLIGGPAIGQALVGNEGVDAVCFTGSTATAQRIAQTRADIGRADSVLIAETGGINAMIVDSTALLEQVVRAVVASAFQSAGQRCSACRLVCIQEDVADDFEHMLAGAIDALEMGDPAKLSTDVGPIIDAEAQRRIADYVAGARTSLRVIGEVTAEKVPQNGHFIAPIALAMKSIAEVKQEIFGPILHVVRFAAKDVMKVVDQVNALGYGLTLGVHSRIDERIAAIADAAHVGNVYVNRNQIGAVVGVQPFGGEGLSGTGPKAGGPHYVLRLSQRQLHARPVDTKIASISVADADPSVAKAVQSLRHAQVAWAATDRQKAIEALAAAMGLSDFDVSEFVTAQRSFALPGPTGEDNRLSLKPRGVMLCLGSNDDPLIQNRHLLAALAAGNAALLIGSSAKWADNAPSGLVAWIDAPMERVLAGEFDAVLADGTLREGVAQALAKRTGAIIPLLSIHDDPYRFFHERTVTIDTTAAGGNATLLAMTTVNE